MFNFWLIKICVLSLLHKGSQKYRFYFENLRSHLNGLRAKYSDSSVRMIRLREQKSIFTGLWIHDILVTLQSRLAKIDLLFCKYPQGTFLLFTITTSWLKNNARTSILILSRHFLPICVRYLTKWIDWEGLGKRHAGTRQSSNVTIWTCW